MPAENGIPLAKEVGRVPPFTVPLDVRQEVRYQRLAEEVVMVDVHQHPFVLPENLDQLLAYLRRGRYRWGYQAVKHGGWTCVTTANVMRGLLSSPDISFIDFEDLLGEVGMMLADVARQGDVVQVGNAAGIEAAKQRGVVGFLPTLEHLAIGNRLERLDVLYDAGVRLAGLTYNRKNYIGDGLYERNDGGLSEFGIEVVHRMNELGMAIDLSHASYQTAMDAIQFSRTPVTFSHNASYTLRPTRRARKDDELEACAEKGGLVAITAVPNSLSDDPEQDIGCVLDMYDYMVRLVGVEHVAIGTDTIIGDHVDFHRKMMGRDAPGQLPAPYLKGLESPADGKNILRGLVSRGYSDEDVKRIAGGNALAFFRRVMK
jgi:membrane dipeptidase